MAERLRQIKYLESAKITVTGIAATTLLWMYVHIKLVFNFDSYGQLSETAQQSYKDQSIVLSLIGLITALCYLFWSTRAYANAKRLLDMNGGGSLAVWGWFLPVANLILPCVVLMRTMRGSCLSASLPYRSWIVLCWWLPFLTFVAASQQILSHTVDYNIMMLCIYIGLVAYPIAGSVLIYCIMKSTRLQEAYIDQNPLCNQRLWERKSTY